MLQRIAVFEVLEPGILTTVQDLGRYGFSQFGVPPSGALDAFSLRVGNLLVGNEEKEACLEITLMGLKLRALRDVVFAITGGDLSPFLNGDPLDVWRTHLLVEGDVITFKRVKEGCRSYLTVGGGLAVPKIMGSRSTCLPGKFGGLEGRILKGGDLLYAFDRPSSLSKLGLRFPGDWIPSWNKETVIRVVLGPQDDHFTEKGLQTFFSSIYHVTRQCDRMGVRLEGTGIERQPDREESIVSEGLVSGVIQVPGDGKPIIILAEMVTGGYAKIATVISVDLPIVAQLKPGDRVRFEPVSIKEAHRFLREQEERLRKFKTILQERS